jgi:hypothetical protein
MHTRDAVRISIYAVSVGVALAIFFTACDQGAGPAAAGAPDAGADADADARPAGIAPSGRFPVGTALYEAVDPRRPEPQTADPDDRRAVVFRAWYPAENPADLPTAPYFLNAREGQLNAQLLSLPGDVFASMPTHAVRDARPAPGAARFPVLIFSPGKDTPAAFYSYLLEDLASHGYVVFAVSHPFGSGTVVFADGRVAAPAGQVSATQTRDQAILTWSADQRLVLATVEGLDASLSGDRFSGRLDLSRLGVFGHSQGAAAAAHSCLEELRFRVCANMDGSVGREVLSNALLQPFLLLRSGGPENAESTLVPFFDRLRGIAYRAELQGAGHNTFSDIGTLVARLRLDGVPVDPAPLLLGSLPAARGFELVSRHLVAFFETHLRGANSPILQVPSRFPEVTLELRPGRD